MNMVWKTEKESHGLDITIQFQSVQWDILKTKADPDMVLDAALSLELKNGRQNSKVATAGGCILF